MLKKRRQSKHLCNTTAANRRKRKLANNKQKVFNRHRAYLLFMD